MVTRSAYPVQFNIDYPKKLSRLTTFFRIFLIIPIYILFQFLTSASIYAMTKSFIAAAPAFLTAAPLLMILFRQKYPKWWFDWNSELLKFSNRIGAYFALLTDKYPSTTDEQSVHLKIPYPNAKKDLNRWLPLVKWLLAFPHYIFLAFLSILVLLSMIIAWFAILITGKYPKELFYFIVGVTRWYNRVLAYAVLLTTDRYPPFSLN